ncbi:MAG: UDP-2,4-diacetamido-2,4,6-trideoxy-beta-L-altropyranose hydrolase [Emcibacteraceae bacterium]|nr:UDP-2,4-diacetamido-2,4,6-trideoxy-beta-L-altropyranose hydrolase [Emcibacteraceae bacterium]
MSKFVIRTAVGENIGIGHLMRCLHLAREIEAQGGQTLFALDHVTDELLSFLEGQDFICLYSAVQSQINSQEDARLLLEHTKGADWIILDDYRINQDWEGIITAEQRATKLCVIDDLERSHTCDVVIDVGSRGEQSLKDWNSRVPEHCQKLLGPHYVILSKHYQSPWQKQKKNETYSILLSLGGGGDLQICVGITDALLDAFDTSININILIGPLSQGQDELKAKYRDTDNVNCLTGIQEAYSILQKTDLYIGAAGTMLLQVRCLNMPALTFSIANNQNNDIFNLEKIGHYFHLNSYTNDDFPAFAKFAQIVYDHYDRVLQMGLEPQKPIDGLGSKRITATFFENESIEPASAKLHNNDDTLERLATGYAIRPVSDHDINLYRCSRNLEKNHQFMSVAEKIAAIGHYSWWFNSMRESFIVEKNNKPSLIIWHQRVQAGGKAFMNAGWFVCDEKGADFKDVLLSMSWQVKYCYEHHKGIPWLSVVKKDNTFAQQINDYFGFEKMEEDHPFYPACTQMFSLATKQDFHYIIFENKSKIRKRT